MADWKLFCTWTIFALTYAGLALGRIPGLRTDRAGIALVGATLLLVSGVLSLDEAVSQRSIDYKTLLLLFGMMIVVGGLRLSGFFQQLTTAALRHIASPAGLLAATIALAGVLSAFLINDVVCVAMTPLVVHVARRMKFDPLPHLVGLATASNIGSTATITGNPQNIYIGAHSSIGYLDFAWRLMPVALAGLVVDYVVIGLVYRRRLTAPAAGSTTEEPHASSDRAAAMIRRRAHARLRVKAVTVTAAAVVMFCCGLPLELVALGAAGVMLLGRVNPQKIFRQVDWSLLVMFAGLFVVVHAFQVEVVADWKIETWTWLLERPVGMLSLVSAGLSNVVSNVPAVLLLEPVATAMPEESRRSAWLALAMSSTLAGNLTVLGSVANLIVVESAKREGAAISFWEYSKAGIPVTLLTLALGVAWLVWTPY